MEKNKQEKLEIINYIRNLYPTLPNFYNKQNIIGWNNMKGIFYHKQYSDISLNNLKKLKEIAEREYKNEKENIT